MQKVFIVFSDLSGFSKLNSSGQQSYLNIFRQNLAPAILPFFEKAIVRNTWGDATISLFEQGEDAIRYMLHYRELSKKFCHEIEGQRVLPRIAGHYGEATIYFDPLLNKQNALSAAVNTAARIEPVTRPGEIFVSEDFKAAIFSHYNTVKLNIRFDEIGKIELPKSAGVLELFKLVEANEEPHILEEIFTYKEDFWLYKPLEMTEAEETFIAQLKTTNKETLTVHHIEELLGTNLSMKFALNMAELNKKNLAYEEALRWIAKVEHTQFAIGTKSLQPFKSLQRVLTIKSDILSSLEQYDDCIDILFNLKNHLDGANAKQESEILARLAAQFKKNSLFFDGEVAKEELPVLEIIQIAELYLEAFRLDITNYYPAINAAYLLTILDATNVKKGMKLAQYISNNWSPTAGIDAWQDLTLIEAHIILQQYDNAYEQMVQFIKNNYYNHFMLQSCIRQLTNYFSIIQPPQKAYSILSLLQKTLQTAQEV